jgi:RHS repeat-associated protein
MWAWLDALFVREDKTMDCQIAKECRSHYTVGDPVDVVSGANTDITLDFKLTGPIPFNWNRYYNSTQNDQLSSLGWGQRHEYDQLLQFDADGILYINPAGEIVIFPHLHNDDDEATSGGLTLRRISSGLYSLFIDRGRVLDFEVDNLDLPVTLTSLRWGPFSIEFRYGTDGRLERIIDSTGRSIRVDHNNRGLISGLYMAEPQKNRDRRLVTYRYDDAGNLIEGMDPYGHTFSFKYDENNRMISRTDRRGYSFHFEYDQNGQCIHSHGEDGLHEVRLRYMQSDGSTLVTKADGGKWTYLYDENGTIRKIIDPYDGEQRYVIDENGRVVEEIDPNGNAIHWIYNDEGGLVGKVDDLNRSRPIEGEAESDRAEKRDIPKTPIDWELGGTWAFGSYRLPRPDSPVLARVAQPISKFVRMARSEQEADSISKPRLTPVGPPKAPGETKYDIFGTLISHTDLNGATQHWRYDPNGNLVRHTDAGGSEWRSEYTSWNLLASKIDPLNNATSYIYTHSEKLARVIDPRRTASDFAYDLKDRNISIARHGTKKDIYRYDKADNLIEKLDSEGRTLFSIEIGMGNLPETIRFPSGKTRVLEYDSRGRLVRALSAGIDQRMEYDQAGNRLLDEHNGSGVRNKVGGLNPVETTVFDRFKIGYGQDKKEGDFIIDPTGGKHFIKYLGHGLLLRSLSNGAKELCQYDWGGRCLLKVAYDASDPQQSWARQYWYSPVGNLILAEDSKAGAFSYRYDSAHRLVREVDRSGREQVYSYDGAGNLLDAPGLSGVQVSENRLVTANGCRFEYNNRNHLARRIEPSGTIEYEYDTEDRLTRCVTPEGVWRARYDALGRRISKTWKGHTTEYYWDRERLVTEVFSDGRVRIYVYVDTRARIPFMFVEYDDLNTDPASGRLYFIYTNQIGCPVRVEDASRRVVWSATISPYGKADIDPGSSIEFCLIFPGHYLDEEIGLHYNFHRYYSPELGRYIQSDPIDIDGGINVYAYTPRPLNEVDLDGLACPRKKIILDPPDEANFRLRQDQAARLEAALRDELMYIDVGWDSKKNKPIPLSSRLTLAVLTVRQDGKWRNVIAANNRNDLDNGELMDAIRRLNVTGGHDLAIPQGNDIKDWKDSVYAIPERQKQPGADKYPTVKTLKDGEEVEQYSDTRNHAERQGLRWADEQENVEGVGNIDPTKPCCGGCQADIMDRGDSQLKSVPDTRVPPKTYSAHNPPKGQEPKPPGTNS